MTFTGHVEDVMISFARCVEMSPRRSDCAPGARRTSSCSSVVVASIVGSFGGTAPAGPRVQECPARTDLKRAWRVRSAAVLQEPELVPDLGHGRRVDVGEQDAL